ncbi:multifunctional CCA addition/repair protein [Thauera aromatica]|uniref:multifunctional CCA addition/repair protein n=1 Tax=Thauera aromatica TaxID=59405 RepID=UPI001FFD1837|nr:multifunctional CCA addition/repair protein [Thauera aromatica]MCK2095954.1 multifunctional CCA addition/repair protein [Thauera aromatica]
MQTYVVGGAVRDALLGLPVQDRDWVVVGSTPEAMLAQGFRPVGRDFPVFLHPETNEEYALARTERKSGHGYTGFVCHASPDVTLEQDLLRRDLTINAIARDREGRLIDPYGGVRDLEARVFRHVSPAFAEDPLRILRVARFAARFTAFTVAPETLALMRRMVDHGEVDHLVAERVWQEFARGLMEAQPSRMIRSLRECGALARLLPELDRLFGIPQPERYHPEIDTGEHVLQVLDQAAACALPLAVRWACLLHDLGKGDTPAHILPHHYGHEAASARRAREVSIRLKAPAECRELAEMVAREHGILGQVAVLRPQTVVALLERCDVLRRPERFERMLQAAACDHAGRGTAAAERVADWPPLAHWRAAARAVRALDAGAIARSCPDKSRIADAIHAAQVAAVRALDATAATARGAVPPPPASPPFGGKSGPAA